ncbi:MAG: glycosyltransferase [Planctomycetota bacterium]
MSEATIGLCTFNGSARLPANLHAIAACARNHDDLHITRLVVVDNASTDNTADVVRSFAAEQARTPGALPVELLNEPTPGKINAMRALFAQTTEPIVLTTDDDTLPDPTWTSGLLSVFADEPRAGIVTGPVRNIWQTGPTPLARVYHRSLGDQDLGPTRVLLDRPTDFVMGASMGVRREALEASGWLDQVMLVGRTGTDLECGAEDAEVCIRVRQAGWQIWYEPTASMGHVIPPERQTAAYLAKLRGAICRGEPALQWVAGEIDDHARATQQAARARHRYLKSLLFTWNRRRRIRLAERRGKAEGWQRLAERLAP